MSHQAQYKQSLLVSLQTQYDQLLAKIDELGTRQKDAYPKQLKCKAGCFQCCKPPESLFAIEAERLKAAVFALPEEEKQAIFSRLASYVRGQRLLCPLLSKQGNCTVYEARPVICRTHGYAIWHKATDPQKESFLSWCELNFKELQPDRSLAFDLERLNTMLSMIARLGWDGDKIRISLIDLLFEALGDNPSYSDDDAPAFLQPNDPTPNFLSPLPTPSAPELPPPTLSSGEMSALEPPSAAPTQELAVLAPPSPTPR